MRTRQALPFDDESFDLVICQFGVMFSYVDPVLIEHDLAAAK